MEKGIGSRFSGWVRTPKRLSIPILGSVLIATLLVGVIAGTVLGESNLITRIFEEVRVAVTGRLPLEEWQVLFPVRQEEGEKGRWVIPEVSRSSTCYNMLIIDHRVSPPRVARELLLELADPYGRSSSLDVLVYVRYEDGTGDQFPHNDLGVSGGTTLRLPLRDVPVSRVFLEVTDSVPPHDAYDYVGVTVVSAELLVR